MSYYPFFYFNSFLQGRKGSHEHQTYYPFHDGWSQNNTQPLKNLYLLAAGFCKCARPLLPSSMKVIKGKTIHEINGLIRNIQYFSGTGALTLYNVF